MRFEIALNLLWACLALMALISTLRICRRSKRRSGKSRWLLVVGVGLIIAALFPYVSATDDVLRVGGLTHHANRDGTKQHGKTDDLVRLFEVTDTPLVCRVPNVSLIFVFVAFVFALLARRIDRTTPFTSGRSPPFCVAAS